MNVRAYVAEFFGTFALVWVGIYAIHHLGSLGAAGLVGIALAHGLAIALLASATMAVSGGHLNPAVTVAMLMARKIKFVDALGYIAFQLAGGFVAAMAVTAVPLFDATKELEGSAVVLAGTPQFSDSINASAVTEQSAAYSVWMLEAIATFFLMFVVLGTAADKRHPRMGGLYIGLAVTMGILAIGPFTGAALNPARWLGPAVVGKIGEASVVPFKWLAFGYVIGPLTGAIIAAFVWQLVMASRDQLAESA
jgi:aquaporin Z